MNLSKVNLIFYFSVISIVILSGGFLSLLRGEETMMLTKGGDIVQQIIYLFIYTISAMFLLSKGRNNKFNFKNQPVGFYLLVCFIFLSVIWSVHPEVTLRKGFALIGTIVFSVFLYRKMTVNEIINAFHLSFIVIIISSYIFILVFPDLGIMYESGWYSGEYLEQRIKWQGVFNHKNSLGRVSSLGVLFFVILLYRKKISTFRFVVVLTSLAVLIAGSRSSTAIVVLSILILVFFGYILITNIKKTQQFTTILMIMLFSITIMLVFINDPFFIRISNEFYSLDIDEVLTGRVSLWESLMPYLSDNLFLGYGYYTFWLNSNDHVTYLSYINNWNIPHAHNGFIDIILNTGLTSLVLFLIVTFKVLKKYSNKIYRNRTSPHLFFYFFIYFMIFYNLTESSLLRVNSVFTVIFVLSVIFSYKNIQKNS